MLKRGRMFKILTVMVLMFLMTVLMFSVPVEAAKPGGGGGTTSNRAPVIYLGGTQLETAAVTINEDSTWQQTLKATDADKNTMTWKIIALPANGTVSMGTLTNSRGTSTVPVTYDPNDNYNGADSFKVQVNDGNSGIDTITINVTINPVNDAPMNTSAPSINGPTSNGAFTVNDGTWTDVELSTLNYAYQWQRASDANGTSAADVTGATSNVYTPGANDAGKYIRARVTASDPQGASNFAYSAWTFVESATPPLIETINYVSLGDSIATGTTGTSSTISFPYKLRDYLQNTYYPKINAGQNKTTNVNFKSDAINGLTSIGLIDWLVDEPNVADNFDQVMVDDIKAADIITLSIGGNDLMQHATIPGFATVDWAGATKSKDDFVSYSWNTLIATIKSINSSAELIVTTGYNPYNLEPGFGYGDDVQPAAQTESLVTEMRSAVITNAERLNADNTVTVQYQIADVYTDFHLNQPNKMGDITSFYPFYLFKITRDPHPNQTGQNRIFELFKAYFPVTLQ